MAGEAQTSQFLLSTATLMVGPSDKVMELSPALHSIGLVKNVQVSTTPKFVELTQGIQAQTVFTVNTELASKIMAEVYEYTAANLAYANGLDATTGDFAPETTSVYDLATAITTGGSTVHLGTGDGADWDVGDFLVIGDLLNVDRVHVGKVASISTDVLTLETDFAMPSGMTFATATSKIYKVKGILVGSNDANVTVGVKLVGVMPSSGEPITLVFPKVRIVKGMDLNFTTKDFGNMPFEFQPYSLLPTDPFYSTFGGSKPFGIFKTQ